MRLAHKLPAAAALTFSMVALPAAAVPVTGQISLSGYAQSNTGSMGTATGISFANASGSSVSGASGLLTSYGAGSGSFAALGACSNNTTGCGTIMDIANFASTGPIANLLTLSSGTAVAFDLSSVTRVSHDVSQNSLTFFADGIIRVTGYDPTYSQFVLTAQGNDIVSFSAIDLAAVRTVAAVPEAATWSMMILGMGAIGCSLRRRQKINASVKFA